MTKRYRERLEDVELAGEAVADTGGWPSSGTHRDGAPAAFRWRGRRYRVTAVLGHWHEDAGWWRQGDGVPRRIERTDLWRVEAGGDLGGGAPSGERCGVYELVRRAGVWRLDRIWD